MVKMKLPKIQPKLKKNNLPLIEINPLLTKITFLASILPPASPSNSNLNPLKDLINLFKSIPLLINDINTNNKVDLNNLLELNRQLIHTSLHSLKSIFETLIQQGRLHGILKSKKLKMTSVGTSTVTKESDSVTAVRIWLNQRWEEYITRLVQISTAHWDTGIRLSALNAAMSLLRTESQFLTSLHSTRQAQFATSTFSIIVRGILQPTNEDGVLTVETLEEWKKWWDRYDDIRFYFLKEATVISALYTKSTEPSTSSSSASTSSTPLPIPIHLASNLLSTLEILTTMPTTPSELNEWWCATPLARKAKPTALSKKRKLSSAMAAAASGVREDGSTGVFDSSSEEEEEEVTRYSSNDTKKLLPPLLTLASHRRGFQDAWLGLLSLGLNESEAKRVLVILHRQVLPHMTDPKRLMDWLVDSTEAGGTVGILALNGLFTLMQKHNLEYPDFFAKLYAMLDRDILHVRYRPRFFRLLEIFMSSSHLSSALVASFIKRLARLSLSAPPAGIVTVIPFIYNMLKLHPSCMTMIHRPSVEGYEDEILGDPFNPIETDPTKTYASDSSLWELASLRTHYLAAVSGLAKIFAEVMTKQSYAMEDFLDHSYGTMFETEITRKIRNAPALAPVPARQPIGDSFFPTHKNNVSRKTGEEEEDLIDEEPVDIVSRIFDF